MSEKIKEFNLIKQLSELLESPSKEDAIGIGDDCAVILPGMAPLLEGHSLLMSCDSMVENRHFYRDKASPEELGWKLMAQASSDIAAMGGSPLLATVAVNISPRESVDYLAQLYSGINEFSKRNGFFVLGGDTSSADEFSLSATILGSISSPAVLRSNAQVGDDIWISGAIGGAGAGLQILQGKRPPSDYDETFLSRFNKPLAQIKLGPRLAGLANSMIDVSDGLIADLRHLCESSGLSATLNLARIPIETGLENSINSILRASSSGEDYELLLSSSKERVKEIEEISNSLGIPLTKIGEFREQNDSSILATYNSEEKPIENFLQEVGLSQYGGWEHEA